MRKYAVLDNKMTVRISAPEYMASALDASLAAMKEQRGGSTSEVGRKAIIGYARLMRGIDIDQAAAVLALTRWLKWTVEK